MSSREPAAETGGQLPRRPLPQQLPDQRVPFPVSTRYQIRPDLRKLEPHEQHFVRDGLWPRYLARKLELLTTHPHQCRLIGGSEEQLGSGLRRVAGLLASEHPEVCRLEGRSVMFPQLGIGIGDRGELQGCGEPVDSQLHARIRRHLEPLPATARLADALALAVQEDLVLIAGPPGGDGARLLHVCFSSHWNPGERRLASFIELHEPVPHNERLMAGSKNLVSAMLGKGPFIRHVWSITSSAELDRNPARAGEPVAPEGALLDSLYFRAERQTTAPLGDLALFTIRIYVTPLREMLDPERARTLALAIRSMDEELLRYKNLTGIRDPLLAQLDEFASSRSP